MKHAILLPTDFSDNAWNAAVYAFKLYANETCTFYFLHSWSITNATARTYITTHYVDTLEEVALNRIVQLKETAEQTNTNANHNFELILSKDNLLLAIELAIEKYNIDCVVMGTKGATKAEELLFGSHTVNVLKKMKLCPVLVIPEDYDFKEPKQIAFPTDFTRFYGEELEAVRQLAELFNSKIRIVHITQKNGLTKVQDYNLSMLNVYLENQAHSFHWLPDYANKTQEINDFIKELDIDILTMINYKHSFIEDILNEPVVKKIGFRPSVPFLVIPHVI